MSKVESSINEFESTVVDLANVPAGAMRLLFWPSGELQYGCRCANGGWRVSNRIALRDLVDQRANGEAWSELEPVLDAMIDGGEWAPFDGDYVGGLVGYTDTTAKAGVLYAVFAEVDAKRRARRLAQRRARESAT